MEYPFLHSAAVRLGIIRIGSACIKYFAADWSCMAFLPACCLYASTLFGLGDLRYRSNSEGLDNELVYAIWQAKKNPFEDSYTNNT